MTEVQTKLFKFGQNNSGGNFVIDDVRGLGPNVYIEAVDHNHANSRAEDVGIYFNGCDDGRDCDCCGDRWHTAWKEDGLDGIEINHYTFGWHDTIYIHRLNGTIERIVKGAK